MLPVNTLNNVKIDDGLVECYYTGFKKNDTLNYKFYKELSLNTTTYTVGNFVIINEENSVAKILCIYNDQNKIVQLVVRKYPFAKFLKLKDFNISLEDSEIIEDLRKDYTILTDKIMIKCFVIFGNENESVQVIEENNLDPSVYFFCRYSLKSDGLYPIFSTPSVILSENNMKNTPRKLTSEKKRKPKSGLENKNILGVPIEKISSPKRAHKDINLSPPDSCFYSPVQRNLVRRNLNESFGAYNTETNSVLNYSIVSDEDIENPLLLKLRISDSNKKPLVLLRKSDDPNSSMKKKEPIRKSSRKIQRISYADYISPIKMSPRKRCNSNTSLNEASPNKRQLEKLGQSSHLNKNRNSGDNTVETTLGKRIVRTPKMYQGEMEWDSPESNSKGSARRSLRLTVSKEFNESVKTSGNRVKRERSATVDRGTEPVQEKTPQKKKVNLNESIRRSILRINLKKVDEDILKSNNQELRKKKSNYKYLNGYSTSSDSEESVNHDSVTSSSPKTPKRTKDYNESESDHNFSPKTPKTNSTMKPKRTSNKTTNKTPKTPRNRSKLIRDGIITPSMQSRSKVISGDSTPLMKARSQLHVSYIPNALPCRDTEYRNILEFLESALLDGCGGCMYVSGVPGTGKTATVSSVISFLQHNNGIPKFNYVNLNGMRLTEPRQSYVEIWKQLTGKTVPWEQAQSMLEEKFTKSKKMAPTVMLVDELDILYTKRQDVVYNLLDWPTKAKNQLIVITIANTMDLPERLLMNRVASRLGLTRLTFQAYTHKQLQEIVKNRLSGIECFNPDAVEFVARKVASVSGDARRALDICRRAAEIAEAESSIQLVNMSHVNKAVNAMITQPKVRAIKNCSRLEQLILQSIVAEVERTGVEETCFSDVFKMLVSCAAIEGFKMVSSTSAFAAVSRLNASRLILSDSKCNDVSQKLILNVSVDDVYYALKKDQS